MRRQSMSNTEAIVAQGMRPACAGEPFGAKPIVRTYRRHTLYVRAASEPEWRGQRDLSRGEHRALQP